MGRAESDLAWLTSVLGGSHGKAAVRSPVQALAPFPSSSRPRILVPLGSRRAAAASVAGSPSGGAIGRFARASSAAALRSGLLQRLLPNRVYLTTADGQPALGDYFGEVFQQDVEVAVRVPPRRPNRKPLLQLLTRDGDVLGFAKVGWNELTRSLVANEKAVLETLADRPVAQRDFEAPRVLHFGRWRDLDLLVLSPLELRRNPVPVERVGRAAAVVAALTPGRRTVVAETAYWIDVRARVSRVDAALQRLVTALEHRYGDREVDIGRCHGDWASWNMGYSGNTLAVWDWERSRDAAPVGVDAAHFDFHAALTSRPRRAGAPAEVVLYGRGVLAACGIPPRERLVPLSLHLLEMALRWEEGRKAGVAAADNLYRPTLEALLASPRPDG